MAEEHHSTKTIFISYGREPEVSSFVKRLKDDLELSGLVVWLDSDDIPAGSEWPKEIGIALDRCTILIAVVTAKYVSSRYCKAELYTALDTSKQIFPIIYDDITTWRHTEAGAGVRYVITPYNWTMFRPSVDNYESSLSKLLEALGTRNTTESKQMHSDEYCDEDTQMTSASEDRSTDMDDTAVQSGMGDRERKTTALDDIHVEVPRDTSTRFQRSAPLRGQALVDADMPPVNMTTSLLSVGGPVDRSLLCIPSIGQLSLFRSRNTGTQIKIINAVAPKWRQFAVLLDFDEDGTIIDHIQAEKAIHGPVDCCTEMFKTWLRGEGKQPASWELLIELLDDFELKYLAQQVRDGL